MIRLEEILLAPTIVATSVGIVVLIKWATTYSGWLAATLVGVPLGVSFLFGLMLWVNHLEDM